MFKTLGLALAAVTLISAPALAQSYRVPTANLHTAEGSAKFENRIRRVSNRLCLGYTGYTRYECVNAVREEALSQLPRAQRLAYEQTRSNSESKSVALASL